MQTAAVKSQGGGARRLRPGVRGRLAARRTGRLEGVPPRARPLAVWFGAARAGPRRSRVPLGPRPAQALGGVPRFVPRALPRPGEPPRDHVRGIPPALRRRASEPAPAEYERRFGVDVRDWPFLPDAPTGAESRGTRFAAGVLGGDGLPARLGPADGSGPGLSGLVPGPGRARRRGRSSRPGKVSRGARSTPRSSTSCTARTPSSRSDWPGP